MFKFSFSLNMCHATHLKLIIENTSCFSWYIFDNLFWQPRNEHLVSYSHFPLKLFHSSCMCCFMYVLFHVCVASSICCFMYVLFHVCGAYLCVFLHVCVASFFIYVLLHVCFVSYICCFMYVFLHLCVVSCMCCYVCVASFFMYVLLHVCVASRMCWFMYVLTHVCFASHCLLFLLLWKLQC